jgi:hypothetical protein
MTSTAKSADVLRDTARAGVREASGMWWWFLILGIVWTALGMYVLSYRVGSVRVVATLVGVAFYRTCSRACVGSCGGKATRGRPVPESSPGRRRGSRCTARWRSCPPASTVKRCFSTSRSCARSARVPYRSCSPGERAKDPA